MSATTTSSAAAATCTGGVSSWILPVQDAACGLPSAGNASAIMDKCCGIADVTSFNDDCGLYCLAQGQNVGDLLHCIEDAGAIPGQFFCTANQTATATAAPPSQTSDNDDDDDNNSTSTSDNDAAEPSESDNAGLRLSQPVSKTGLGVIAMLFCSALFGVAT
ncbi:hypothetical protein BJY01DRAFT_245775 [Aspergillus pseudoustus]|uniref:Extracellular membrane protein CFEM domain-containing protein n=1 Tax=Aspergillus pseudoustus TaxID=1810923 RepID=A0ABR4KET6_9EURO